MIVLFLIMGLWGSATSEENVQTSTEQLIYDTSVLPETNFTSNHMQYNAIENQQEDTNNANLLSPDPNQNNSTIIKFNSSDNNQDYSNYSYSDKDTYTSTTTEKEESSTVNTVLINTETFEVEKFTPIIKTTINSEYNHTEQQEEMGFTSTEHRTQATTTDSTILIDDETAEDIFNSNIDESTAKPLNTTLASILQTWLFEQTNTNSSTDVDTNNSVSDINYATRSEDISTINNENILSFQTNEDDVTETYVIEQSSRNESLNLNETNTTTQLITKTSAEYTTKKNLIEPKKEILSSSVENMYTAPKPSTIITTERSSSTPQNNSIEITDDKNINLFESKPEARTDIIAKKHLTELNNIELQDNDIQIGNNQNTLSSKLNIEPELDSEKWEEDQKKIANDRQESAHDTVLLQPILEKTEEPILSGTMLNELGQTCVTLNISMQLCLNNTRLQLPLSYKTESTSNKSDSITFYTGDTQENYNVSSQFFIRIEKASVYVHSIKIGISSVTNALPDPQGMEVSLDNLQLYNAKIGTPLMCNKKKILNFDNGVALQINSVSLLASKECFPANISVASSPLIAYYKEILGGIGTFIIAMCAVIFIFRKLQRRKKNSFNTMM